MHLVKGMLKKILLLGNCYYVIFRFRKELIQRLVSDGYEVWVSFPNASHGEKERGEDTARELKCHFAELEMERRSANPLKEIWLYQEIKKLVRQIRPNIILTFTVKPNLYGGMAAWKYHIPYIMNITGLGSALGNDSIMSKVLLRLTINRMKKASCVFFQNENDREYFRKNGFDTKNDAMLPGSGVNIEEYKVLPYPEDTTIRFFFIARVMKEKGIEEFLSLAEYFQKNSKVEFHICGDCEEEYSDILRKMEKDGIIIYHGQVSNIIDFEKMAHCLVLPSFYHEGISNSLLEAAACGRPIITTDHPGCREVVNEGETGFLVRVKNSDDLIDAVEQFLQLTYEGKKNMGMAGRVKMEKEFNRQIVVGAYLEKVDRTINGEVKLWHCPLVSCNNRDA